MPYYILEIKTKQNGGSNLLKEKLYSKTKGAKTAATSIFRRDPYKNKVNKTYYVCVRKTCSNRIIQYKVRRQKRSTPLVVNFGKGSKPVTYEYENKADRVAVRKCNSKIVKEDMKIKKSKERCGPKRKLSFPQVAMKIMSGKNCNYIIERSLNNVELTFAGRYRYKWPSVKNQSAKDKKNIKDLKNEIVGYLRTGKIKVSEQCNQSKERKPRALTAYNVAKKIAHDHSNPRGYYVQTGKYPPTVGEMKKLKESEKAKYLGFLNDLKIEIADDKEYKGGRVYGKYFNRPVAPKKKQEKFDTGEFSSLEEYY